jgi:hypothetical protein
LSLKKSTNLIVRLVGPFDPGLLNLRSLYMYIVRPKFSVTKVSG